MNNNNRFLVGIVIALAVLLGVVGISGISYREGFSDGAMRAPQYVYPPDDAPRVAPVPAPVPAPGYYAQPYSYGRPGGWGWGGGFNPLGLFFNILLIGGVIFIVSRLFFRRRFGGHGPWSRGGWGGHGPGGHGWGDWHRSDPGKDEQPREQPRKRDDEVI